MNTHWIEVIRSFRGFKFRCKALEKILEDLEKIKSGQDAITQHLDLQDIMLRQILNAVQKPTVLHAVFRVVYDNGTIVNGATSVEMKINQQFTCSVEFEDAAGNVASVEGAPEWSVDPDGVLALEPAPDGMSVLVKSGTKAGSAQLLCKADADLGAGVKEITGMLAVNVLPGDAVTVTLNPGEVTDIPQTPA